MALERDLPDLSSQESWQRFLTDQVKFQADDIDTFATALCQNGTTKNTLVFLHSMQQSDRVKTLQDLGISKLGCALAILGYLDTLSRNARENASNRRNDTSSESHQRKLPPVSRPTATLDMAPQQFRKFRHDWQSFKESYSIPDEMIRNNLYQCCTTDVQTYVYASHPTFLHPGPDE